MKSGTASPEPSEDIEDRAVFMEGMIKWDGCCNFEFPESENCMIHNCGNPGELFLKIWNVLYREAELMMPDTWDKNG